MNSQKNERTLRKTLKGILQIEILDEILKKFGEILGERLKNPRFFPVIRA